MKYLLYLILLSSSFKASSQVYGNTNVPDYGSYGSEQIVWLKIVTGPDDSGFFTHYGIYDHPTQGNTCEIKFAIYDEHATVPNRPQNLLVDDFLANPVNGQWNEHPVGPQVAIEPNTIYWIGLRFWCNYGSGRDAATQWAESPLRFYESWSFTSSWPDPVSGTSASGYVNNVGLYLIGNDMTLPVELTSFEIKNVKEKPMLEWVSVSEINNEGWNVQRSENGFSWTTIGHVSGRGDSKNTNDYSYTDEDVPPKLLFYRLEQIDLDGKTHYTEVKSIDMYRSKISVYPTIVNQYMYVEGLEEESKYQIISNNQVLVKTGSLTNNQEIDISELPSGIYYMVVNEEALRIIKN